MYDRKLIGVVKSASNIVVFRNVNNCVFPKSFNRFYIYTVTDTDIVKRLQMFWDQYGREIFTHDVWYKNFKDIDTKCLHGSFNIIAKVVAVKAYSRGTTIIRVTDGTNLQPCNFFYQYDLSSDNMHRWPVRINQEIDIRVENYWKEAKELEVGSFVRLKLVTYDVINLSMLYKKVIDFRLCHKYSSLEELEQNEQSCLYNRNLKNFVP